MYSFAPLTCGTPAMRAPGIVDGLLTGFHEPGASHLDLLEAFASRGDLQRAYAEAAERGYRCHEYGDLCLIL
jgi:S-adenosylmethionine:tRNA ribosyltransferase-isomerase